MKIENVHVFGFEPALRAMRNPMESWDKNDSWVFDEDIAYPGTYTLATWKQVSGKRGKVVYLNLPAEAKPQRVFNPPCPELVMVGPNDAQLARKLIKAGPEHRKFLRQIMIWCDITIPRYIWQELDTYKVATVRNSCSTMHKLGSRDLEYNDFEDDVVGDAMLNTINGLGAEMRRLRVLKGSEPAKERVRTLHRHLKQLLPEGFLQKATYTMSYETALSMYHQRKNHRLPEWNVRSEGSICSWIKSLPCMDEWTAIGEKKRKTGPTF
jgi:hypothetical protein